MMEVKHKNRLRRYVSVHTSLATPIIKDIVKKADHTAKQSVCSRIFFASHLETDHTQPERLSLILNVYVNFASSTKVLIIAC